MRPDPAFQSVQQHEKRDVLGTSRRCVNVMKFDEVAVGSIEPLETGEDHGPAPSEPAPDSLKMGTWKPPGGMERFSQGLPE